MDAQNSAAPTWADIEEATRSGENPLYDPNLLPTSFIALSLT